MDDTALLIDFYRPLQRLGPGSETHTLRALELSGLFGSANLNVADLGCGTGASTLVLADHLDGEITAVDLFPEFLEELEKRAQNRTPNAQITTLTGSFEDLPFERESLDAIWAEGSIYNLGFEAGLKSWSPFLADGGILAVSELTWLTYDRPAELQRFWDDAYPEVNRASAKFALLEAAGFTPIGYFVLPDWCWTTNFYEPLQARFDDFLREHAHSDAATALVDAQKQEHALYEKYRSYFSYGFYIAQKVQRPRRG
jgi:SAM-dependent methyltransferase